VTNCLIRESLAHCFANAVAHEPRAFQRHAKRTMELIRTDALLARCDQEYRLQPEPQRQMARFEDRPDLDRKRLPAVVALVRSDPGAITAHRAVALDAAAVRADWAARPDASLNEPIGRFLVVEVRGGKNGCAHALVLHCI
jgi:hypothetical protein